MAGAGVLVSDVVRMRKEKTISRELRGHLASTQSSGDYL